MRDFRELKVWHKGRKLAVSVYEATVTFPKEELYGLTSQIRRASFSIPTNIAEGCGRGSGADFARFMQIAMGSACEMECLLMLAHDLNYLAEGKYQALSKDVVEIKRMLTSFMQTLKQ